MIFTVSTHSSQPLYLQLVLQIQMAILCGSLKAGEALPSLRQLASDTGVSLITTKRAYEDLESEGWVVGRTGRGTEVADLSDEFLERRKRELVGVKLTEARELALTLGLDRTMIEEAWKQLWEDS